MKNLMSNHAGNPLSIDTYNLPYSFPNCQYFVKNIRKKCEVNKKLVYKVL